MCQSRGMEIQNRGDLSLHFIMIKITNIVENNVNFCIGVQHEAVDTCISFRMKTKTDFKPSGMSF